jgi:predicted nucleic acid-binding protein
VICVDTSVWIAALRAGAGPEGEHLRRLLDDDLVALAAPVRIEILAGAPRRELGCAGCCHRCRSAPTSATWQRIDGWLSRACRRASASAWAISHRRHRGRPRCLLWSLDRDFRRMERLRFVRLHRS